MSTIAVGAYIRTLREQRNLTMAAVAQTAGVSTNYVWRVENADIKEPGAANVAALVAAVQGSAADVQHLLLDTNATADDGQQLAIKWLQRAEETGMGVIAVGAYLQTLRELRGLGRVRLAADIGTNESQIIRIEKGELDTRGSLLLKFTQAVEGRPEHIFQLMLNDDATQEEGKRMALEWAQLTPEEQEKIDKLIAETPPDKLDNILNELRSTWKAERDKLEQEEKESLLDALEGISRLFRRRGSR